MGASDAAFSGGTTQCPGDSAAVVSSSSHSSDSTKMGAGFVTMSDSELEARIRAILAGYTQDLEKKEEIRREEGLQIILQQLQQEFNSYKTELLAANSESIKQKMDVVAAALKTDNEAHKAGVLKQMETALGAGLVVGSQDNESKPGASTDEVAAMIAAAGLAMDDGRLENLEQAQQKLVSQPDYRGSGQLHS